ncbi:MAG: helix-turn-helix domain-containing protein [Coriobacteriia bacterium]|nr:helix-turn-helix domain-containing protein [Coriobacteriia bacterium]
MITAGGLGLLRKQYLEDMQLLSADYAAQQLGVSIRWFYSGAARRAGVPVIKVGGYLRVRARKLDPAVGRPHAARAWPGPHSPAAEEVSSVRRILLSPPEVASLLGVSTGWLYGSKRDPAPAVRAGLPLRKLGGYLRVSVGDLEDWLDSLEDAQRVPGGRDVTAK